jgi:plastocyanin
MVVAALVGTGCGDQQSGAPRAAASVAPVAAASVPTAAQSAAAVRAGKTARTVAHVDYAGMRHLHYRFGPLQIRPGQNPITFTPTTQKPSVPGYITRFKPDLIYTDGKKPSVAVLHLHHGVWLMRNDITFAAGEEKTITQLPRGFGYRYAPSDPWVVNYMLHNLTPTPARVYLTWDIDFVPKTAPAARDITEVKPLWLDVGSGAYPVFDAQRGWGHNGRYEFPEDARGAERNKIGPFQHITVPHDATLIAAGGHVHPGGLWVDLRQSRGGKTKEIFRSEARYYEPAGAVSWDASMTFTKPNWRVAVRKGDTLSVSATYDTSRASWYEVMGIVDPLWYTTAKIKGAKNPFTQHVDWHGRVTHGHLPENDIHGGTGSPLPDARELAAGPSATGVDIKAFFYALGDLTGQGSAGLPPTIKQGGTLTFRNLDSTERGDPALAVYHTITACKEPCNKGTGIAYPIADGAITFDSGELGYGPTGVTASANRNTWQTPKNLPPGTYSYFCRVHPYMRGAFRVTPD